MLKQKNSGFTIIELLTVIAIIGVLAALIFPVVASSRENAKKAQCTNNIMNVYTAVKQFQLDEHRYPDFIAGPVEYKQDGSVVPLDRSSGMDANGRALSLYPEYIKESTSLYCPKSIVNSAGRELTMVDKFPDPLNRMPPGGNTPYEVYAYSTYDFQKPKGTPQNDPGETHYALSWSLDQAHPEYTRQLKWRNPPADTVVTWCAYHRDVGSMGVRNSSKDLVLFLDGHVVPKPSSLAADPNPGNGKYWTDAWANYKP